MTAAAAHAAKHQIGVNPPCPAAQMLAAGCCRFRLQDAAGAGRRRVTSSTGRLLQPPAPTTEVGHVSERPPYSENLLKSLPRLTKKPAPLWFALTCAVYTFGGLWLPWHRISSTNETRRG